MFLMLILCVLMSSQRCSFVSRVIVISICHDVRAIEKVQPDERDRDRTIVFTESTAELNKGKQKAS